MILLVIALAFSAPDIERREAPVRLTLTQEEHASLLRGEIALGEIERLTLEGIHEAERERWRGETAAIAIATAAAGFLLGVGVVVLWW